MLGSIVEPMNTAHQLSNVLKSQQLILDETRTDTSVINETKLDIELQSMQRTRSMPNL